MVHWWMLVHCSLHWSLIVLGTQWGIVHLILHTDRPVKASENLKVYRSRCSWCRTTHPKASKGWWKYLLLEEWRKNGCSSWSKNVLKYHIIDSPEVFPFENVLPFDISTQKPDSRKEWIMYSSSGLSLSINFYVKTFLKFTGFFINFEFQISPNVLFDLFE
jgi:hypothetical protein